MFEYVIVHTQFKNKQEHMVVEPLPEYKKKMKHDWFFKTLRLLYLLKYLL